MKELLKYLLSVIKNNFWMKIMALGFAALLWVFVIAETNPPRIKEFESIPVTFAGVEELRDKGLTSSQDLNKIISTANATVDAQTDQLKYLKDDNITLTVDLTGISGPGEYRLPIRGRATAGNVTSVNPSEVTVVVEDVVTSELPVEVQMVGDKKDSLYYGEPRLSKNTVTVQGPRSSVEKYAKAVCYLDIEDLTGPVTENKNAVVMDSGGNIVDDNEFLGELPSVIVSLDVYPKKEIPIDTQAVTASITGVAPGYQIDNVILDPASIEVAGPEDILEGITNIMLEPITLNNATVDSTLHASVIIPDGVVALEPRDVEATIQISQILENRVYQAVDVRVKNLGSGLKYILIPESIDVTVTGSLDALDKINASQIKPFVDLAGLGEGTHTATVKFENAPDLGAAPSSSTPTVQVKLEKR